MSSRPGVGALSIEERAVGDGAEATLARLEARILQLETQLNGVGRESLQSAREHSAELRRLSRRLVEALENERRSIARELHDEAGQSLTSLKLGLALLRRQPDCTSTLQASIDELLRTADLAMEGLHRLALNLRPPSLDRYGLVPALEQWLAALERQCGLHVKLVALGLDAERLPDDLEIALYRLIQEALTNVTRHAQASQAGVVVERRKDRITMIVEDNGRGFDVDAALHSGRLGLLGMRERAAMLGGVLTIESAPGQGTTIYLDVPSVAASAVKDGAAPDVSNLTEATSEAPTPLGASRTHPAEGSTAWADAAGNGLSSEAAAELSRAKALSDALLDIIESIVGGSGSSTSLDQVLARTAQATGCESGSIMVRDGEHWFVRYAYGMPPNMREARWKDSDFPSAAWVAQNRQVLVVDSGDDPRVSAEVFRQYGIKSHAALPLAAGDELLGVLTLNRHVDPTQWQSSEVAFLHRLAGTVSLALENARLHEVAVRQHDDLAQRVDELRTLVDMLPVGIALAHDSACQRVTGNAFFNRMLDLQPGSNVSFSASAGERPSNFTAVRDGVVIPPEELPLQVAARRGPRGARPGNSVAA